MRILVTGGTGFTGKALVRRLLDEGHTVVALDNKEGIKTQELRDWGAEVVIGTVTDKPLIEKTMQGVEFVYHLAAAFREMDVPNTYYDDVNIGGTQICLEAAKQAGVKKFVYCSTCGVHGNVENPPANEDAPINAADYYQQTKYEAEPIVLEYAKQGMNTTIIRPAAIYGPGDKERFGMIYRQAKKGFFPIFGSGKTLYHPLYIDNLVDSFINVLPLEVGNGGTYLIADDDYIEIKDLVQKVADSMNKEIKILHLPFTPLRMISVVVEKMCKPLKIAPPIFPRRVDWFKQNRAFDISRAKQEIGYDPKVKIVEGLKNTAVWMDKEGYL